MEQIEALINGLKKFEEQIPQVIERSLQDNEDFILALNYEDQLFDRGVDSNSKALKPPYAESTVSIKKRKHQPTNRVTLRDTGVFHKSFYIYYGSDNFEIMTSDPIEPFLTNRYGPPILGLTDKNLQYVKDRFIGPALRKRIKEL